MRNLSSISLVSCISFGVAFIPAPYLSQAKCAPLQMTLKESSNNRREFLNVVGITAVSSGTLLMPNAARSFFGSDDGQKGVSEIAKYVNRVDKLVDDLKGKTLKGGAEDSDVVFRILKSYLEPLQLKMAETAPKLILSNADQKNRAVTLSLLMKGHLLELAMACKSLDALEQLKESLEVQETLQEFLKLAGTKYNVPVIEPLRSATSAEYYGLYGCEAWGQKRAKDSNSCIPDK